MVIIYALRSVQMLLRFKSITISYWYQFLLYQDLLELCSHCVPVEKAVATALTYLGEGLDVVIRWISRWAIKGAVLGCKNRCSSSASVSYNACMRVHVRVCVCVCARAYACVHRMDKSAMDVGEYVHTKTDLWLPEGAVKPVETVIGLASHRHEVWRVAKAVRRCVRAPSFHLNARERIASRLLVRRPCAVAPAPPIAVGIMYKTAFGISFTLGLGFGQSASPTAALAGSLRHPIGLARTGYEPGSAQANGRGAVEEEPSVATAFAFRIRNLKNCVHVKWTVRVTP